MIETYKILTGKYDGSVAPTLALNKYRLTRGNDLKLEVNNSHYDLRKHFLHVEFLHCGTACLMKLYWLIRQICLKTDLTNFGKIRI